MDKKIGIIGFGNMGQAIGERIKTDLAIFDEDKLKTMNLKDTIKVLLNAALVVQHSDVVILAVKPQDFASLLDSIKKPAAGTNKLFISIAAGITTGYIEEILGNARVIRTMPNMPAQIGEGITALTKGAYAKNDDLKLAEELFSSLGKTIVINESMMSAVTAVSGSGPAYVCYFLEAEGLSPAAVPPEKQNNFLAEFIKAAQGVGFSLEQATQLVNQTYKGTIHFLQRKNATPSQLCKQVTSKGGTTEAALEVLHKGGDLREAVRAALLRAEELSKKEK